MLNNNNYLLLKLHGNTNALMISLLNNKELSIISCDDVISNLPYLLSCGGNSPIFSEIRSHIDGCNKCWNTWWKYRWEVASRSILFKELEAYKSATILKNDFSSSLAKE